MLPDGIMSITVIVIATVSQCTYRCVVLPDGGHIRVTAAGLTSQCTYRCVVLPDENISSTKGKSHGLNAPTGAWCSLTPTTQPAPTTPLWVSMHLQVRGAP